MATLTLPKLRLMQWNNLSVTDHNRAPLNVSVQRIERSTRMANGRLRKFFVADKSTFSVSWEDLPRTTSNTVDGFIGGDGMKAFYEANNGEFTLKLFYGDNTQKTYTVTFTNFTYTISKRGLYDFWNVSCEMTEI